MFFIEALMELLLVLVRTLLGDETLDPPIVSLLSCLPLACAFESGKLKRAKRVRPIELQLAKDRSSPAASVPPATQHSELAPLSR